MTTANFSNIAIVTPINKNSRSKGNIDYQEQQVRMKNGDTMMWDDAKNNPTGNVGGAFGFVHNFKCVEIHLIVGIRSQGERLSSWSSNVGQTDRHVLLLSPKVTTIDWDVWVLLGGAKKVQGTTRVVAAHEALSTHLNIQFENIEYMHETNEIIFT